MRVLDGGKVVAAVPPDPELISIALRHAHSVLDVVDNGGRGYANSSVTASTDARQDARAWQWALLVVIDECEIDSVTIAAIASRIWKGAQDAFDNF